MPLPDAAKFVTLLDEGRRRYDEEWQQRARVYSEVNTLLIIIGAMLAGLTAAFPQVLGNAPAPPTSATPGHVWLRVLLLVVAGTPLVSMCVCLTLIFWQPRRPLRYVRPPSPDKVMAFVQQQGDSYHQQELIHDLAQSYADAASYNGRENIRLFFWLVWTRTALVASAWVSLPLLILHKVCWP